MNVQWFKRAAADRRRQAEHTRKDRPHAALEQIDRLMQRVASLADHPEQGRAGRQHDTRELVVTGTPFVVVYRVRQRLQRVEILRVLHGAQKWPPS